MLDLLAFLTPAASAQTADAAAQGNPFLGMLPLIFIFIAFYFLLIRPQQKKLKLHKEMVAGVQRGDKVITSGGIIGEVTKVDIQEQIVHVEIAEGVRVKVLISTISEVLNKAVPANENNKPKEKK